MANKKKLIVIKVEAIGDYILFRNYLEILKESEKYDGYHVTLVGNILWQSIATKFDAQFVDSFIWINIKRFSSSRLYRFYCYFRLKFRYYDELLCSSHSRRFFIEDDLVRRMRAKIKIGSVGDLANSTPERKMISDDYYSHLISGTDKALLEFERNQILFENILLEKVERLTAPYIQVDKSIKKSQVIIAPGAGASFRQWAPANFANLCDKIIAEYNLDILICGSQQDRAIASEITDRIKEKKKHIQNMCGETSLIELIKLISSANVVVANESSPIHIAAAVNTTAICLSNGNHFGRFNPYSKLGDSEIITLYPPKITRRLDSEYKDLVKEYYNGSNEDINQISVVDVFNSFKEIANRS